MLIKEVLFDIIFCCVRHLGSQLAELERAIEAMMESDFVRVALEDVRARVRYAGKGERTGSPEGVDTEVP